MKKWLVIVPVAILFVVAGFLFLKDDGSDTDRIEIVDRAIVTEDDIGQDFEGEEEVAGVEDGREEGDEEETDGILDTEEDEQASDYYYPPVEGATDTEENTDGPPEEIIALKPSIEERKWGFTSVHQMDEFSHRGEDFDFESAGSIKLGGDSERGLQVHLDYVAPNNPYLNKTVMGFAPYWALDGFYQNYQMEHLSVIAYFAVDCYPDGSLVKTNSGWTAWNSAALANMVTLAHDYDVKVVLTVKNFDKPSIENIVTSSGARSTLVSNIVSQINAKNVDGVNIDFEYIGVANSGLRASFASFIDQVADAVHAARPGSHVSVDIMGTSGIDPLIYDVAALGNTSVDSIMVITYDFHSTYYYSGKKAGPEAPLYGNQYWYTVSRAMNDITSKAPSHKILMGIPYYGLEFPVSGSDWLSKNATVVGTGAIATYANITDPIYDTWHNASTIKWDSGEKMTWYRYRWPSASTGPNYWQGYYDDPNSLGAKYDYVINNNIGGIGIWALGYDNGRNELWATIQDKFSKEPIIVLFKNGVSRSTQSAIHSKLEAQVVQLLVDDSAVIVRPSTKKSVDLIRDYKRRSEVLSADFVSPRGLHNGD